MVQDKIYNELALYYDLVYEGKDYKTESEKVHAIIQKYKLSKGKDLLDVACGTGNHIKYLKYWYKITGLDISRGMLQIAKKKYPKLKFYHSDMSTFKLKKRFDIITCLFSAIAHVQDYPTLKKTIKNMSEHLIEGGIIIIEPFVKKSELHVNRPFATFVDKENIKVARLNVTKRKGGKAILDFHYLIATPEGIKYIQDKFPVSLFEPKKVLRIMENLGLRAEFLEDGLMEGRGIYVGVKELEIRYH